MLFLAPDATAAVAESYPSLSCETSVIISSSEVASDNPPLFASPSAACCVDVVPFCLLCSSIWPPLSALPTNKYVFYLHQIQ